MIVVVIVGVLAMLAVVGYRKLIQASHVTEATGMVQNIRVAEEAYRSETQQYASVSSGLTGDYYPVGAPVYGQVFGWGGATSGAGAVPWSVLPVRVDGPVLFGYAAVAYAAGTTPPVIALDGTATLSFATAPPTDYYIIAARGDLDGDTTVDTFVYGLSMTNQIFVVNEGR
jgi:type IV pilus assembly protein PilA